MKTITVRSGKGDKDSVTTFPESVIPFLKTPLIKVKALHDDDLSQGCGEVYMPNALARKYSNASNNFRNGRIQWGMGSGHGRLLIIQCLHPKSRCFLRLYRLFRPSKWIYKDPFPHGDDTPHRLYGFSSPLP